MLAPWERWDAVYYAKIVREGYRADDGTAQFHPLLPFLAKPFFWSPMLGLMLVSSLASLLFVILYCRLASLDIPNPETSTRLMLAFPASFVLFAPYTESLWLLFAALSIWYARNEKWWVSGVAGAIATLARQQGVLLILPIACELWIRRDQSPGMAKLDRLDADPAGAARMDSVPGGRFLGCASRLHQLQFPALYNYPGPERDQGSPTPGDIASLANSMEGNQDHGTVSNPRKHHELAARLGNDYPRGARAGNECGSYRLLTIGIFAIAFAYYTGPETPYMGLSRHLLLAFPVFICAAPALERWKGPVAAIFMMGMLFATASYVVESWVP